MFYLMTHSTHFTYGYMASDTPIELIIKINAEWVVNPVPTSPNYCTSEVCGFSPFNVVILLATTKLQPWSSNHTDGILLLDFL